MYASWDRAAPTRDEGQEVVDDEDGNDIGGLDGDAFTDYNDASSLVTKGLAPHPSPIAESTTMSFVRPPDVTSKLALPPDVLLKNLSAPQVQALLLAFDRHEQRLPTGERRGFFLGDGPGVGKGRQAAAMVFERFVRGDKKAVWFSAAADLAFDARRDFRDIGALDYVGLLLHDFKRDNVPVAMPLKKRYPKGGCLFYTYSMLTASKGSSGKKGKAKKAVRKSGSRGSKTFDFGSGTRLQQLVDWLGMDFDGMLVFDEAHKAKSCGGGKSKTHASKTAMAVIELQARLPHARVCYVSATGATEAENMGYMTRLGLWGPGTQYRDRKDFLEMMQKGAFGMTAMELVAMELKRNGSLVARTLSYNGVEFVNQFYPIGADFKAMYDASTELWRDIIRLFERSFEGNEKRAKKRAMFGAMQRFFKQMTTAAKVPEVLRIAQNSLKEGKAVVIGLQSTGEARTEAFAESAKRARLSQRSAAAGTAAGKKRGRSCIDDDDDGGDVDYDAAADDNDEKSYEEEEEDDDDAFDAFVQPASLIAQNLIEKQFEIDEKHPPDPGSDVDRILRRAASLVLPDNPLDEIIDTLGGPSMVAEMTGRKRRMIRKDDKIVYVRRDEESTLDMVNILERDAFQSGRKLVAIISDAASAGISLQSDMSCKNQRKRVHITLELAWSADKTVQQLGRSHRSNQLVPPIFYLVNTSIAGENRFSSAVAKRLQQLGALTRGDRRAANAGGIEALGAGNVETRYGTKALDLMYKVILRKAVMPASVLPQWLAEELDETSLTAMYSQREEEKAKILKGFFQEASRALQQVEIFQRSADSGSLGLRGGKAAGGQQDILGAGAGAGSVLGGLGGYTAHNVGVDNTDMSNVMAQTNVKTFLNRLLALPVSMQEKLFGLFSSLLMHIISDAKRKQEYFEGKIPTVYAETMTLKTERNLTLPNQPSSLKLSLTHFEADCGFPFEKALAMLEEERKLDPETESGFYEQKVLPRVNNGHKWILLALESRPTGARKHGRNGNRIPCHHFKIIRPTMGVARVMKSRYDLCDIYRKIDDVEYMHNMWATQYKQDICPMGKLRKKNIVLLTGNLTPILPTIVSAMQTFTNAAPAVVRMEDSHKPDSYRIGIQLQIYGSSDKARQNAIVVLKYMIRQLQVMPPLVPEDDEDGADVYMNLGGVLVKKEKGVADASAGTSAARPVVLDDDDDEEDDIVEDLVHGREVKQELMPEEEEGDLEDESEYSILKKSGLWDSEIPLPPLKPKAIRRRQKLAAKLAAGHVVGSDDDDDDDDDDSDDDDDVVPVLKREVRPAPPRSGRGAGGHSLTPRAEPRSRTQRAAAAKVVFKMEEEEEDDDDDDDDGGGDDDIDIDDDDDDFDPTRSTRFTQRRGRH